jgi:hypothetical protein
VAHREVRRIGAVVRARRDELSAYVCEHGEVDRPAALLHPGDGLRQGGRGISKGDRQRPGRPSVRVREDEQPLLLACRNRRICLYRIAEAAGRALAGPRDERRQGHARDEHHQCDDGRYESHTALSETSAQTLHDRTPLPTTRVAPSDGGRSGRHPISASRAMHGSSPRQGSALAQKWSRGVGPRFVPLAAFADMKVYTRSAGCSSTPFTQPTGAGPMCPAPA